MMSENVSDAPSMNTAKDDNKLQEWELERKDK